MRRQAAWAVLAAWIAAGTAYATADLSITMTDYASHYTAGSNLTYTIVVTNNGPDAVTGAVVADAVTSLGQVGAASWTCTATGDGTCTLGTQVGAINDTVDMPAGATLTYVLVAGLHTGVSGTLTNTATVTAPSGTTDPDLTNNTAADSDDAAGLFYVTVTGTDSDTCGTTVDTPCLTITKAIARASATTGNTVVVHGGTYHECLSIPSGMRVESDEHLASGSNIATFLDATGVCDGSGTTTIAPVVKVADGGAIMGFTIENGLDSGIHASGAVSIVGNAITTNSTPLTGGGIRLDMAGFTAGGLAEITTNRVFSNTSGGNGAGIFVDATASGVPILLHVKTNSISTNTAGDGVMGASGAGLAVLSDTVAASDSTTIVITGNTLDANVANNSAGDVTLAHGGGLYLRTGTLHGAGTETVTLGRPGAPNSARNNVSKGYGGGMSVELTPLPGGTHTVDVQSNNITANSAVAGGGGAYWLVHAVDRSAGAPLGLILRAKDNSIIGNPIATAAPNGPGGGLLAELDSDRSAASTVQLEISENTIESNVAAPYGAGVSLVASADDDPASDGATAQTDAVISFHNNLVAKNAAHDRTVAGVSGGGIHARASARGGSAHAGIAHDFLTVADNQTEVGSGGLEWEDAHPADSLGGTGTTSFSLTNSIVWRNDGYGVGGTVIPGAGTEVTVAYTDAFDSGTADYEAQLGVSPGTNGNISVDPLLDPLYLPQTCSTIVDAGDPSIPPATEPAPNGGRVNLGHLGNTANATRTFPDVNGDHTIDGLDLLELAIAFGATSPSPRYNAAADRDLNGTVDGTDMAYISAFYTQSCP